MKNEQFISGEWYEKSYRRGGNYHDVYVQNHISKWAMQMNQHYVDYITLIHNLRPGASVLEIGCGMGFFIDAWKRRGFNITGVELAKRAIILSEHRDRIVHTSATDLGMFQENQFDLVMSAALMEHLDESILNSAMREMYRVGLRQAHLIGLEKGNDESHINLKTREEWKDRFNQANKDFGKYELVWLVPDFISNEGLCFINTTYVDLIPYPVQRLLSNLQENKPQEKREAV